MYLVYVHFLPIGDTESNETVSESKVSTVKVLSNVDSKIACHECGYDYCEEEILCCFGCSTCYHVFCLTPPLTSLPTGSWYCPCCIAKVGREPIIGSFMLVCVWIVKKQFSEAF